MTPAPTPRPERWAAIPEWPDYEASDLGRIRKTRYHNRSNAARKPFKRKGFRIIRANPSRAASLVRLCRLEEGKWKSSMRHVSHLVAATFLGPRPPGLCVQHVDGNVKNDSLVNLRWATRSTIIRSRRPSRPARRSRYLTEEDHRCIVLMHSRGSTCVELGKQFGVSTGAISKVVRGLVKTRAERVEERREKRRASLSLERAADPAPDASQGS